MSRRLTPISPTVDLGIAGIRDAVEIGRGTRATVYRAVQTALNRPVAVKVLHGTPDTAARLRFDHEAFALGGVSDHPNVLPVHDAGTSAQGRCFLLLQYCPAGSLADHVLRRGPLTWPAAVRIAIDLADALAFAHRHRIVHRDVRPQNVLVADHGRALLADFGVATPGGEATCGAARPGSVLYTAPEVLDGDAAAPSSDVYSLAATVHFLLAGVPPIPARPDEAWGSLYIRLVTAPPTRLPNRLPAGLRDLLYSALAKDACDRPGGAAEFAAAAQGVAVGAGLEPIEPPTRRDWAGPAIRALPSESIPRQRTGDLERSERAPS